MLKSVKIKNYKSIHSLEINLQYLNVLFGPNGAGKSNFLDALQLLSRIATTRTLKEAFTPPYRGNPLESFAFGSDGLKGLLAKDKASFSLEVDIELSSAVKETINRQLQQMEPTKDELLSEDYLRYRIDIQILPKSGQLRVADEFLAALNENGTPKPSQAFIEKQNGQLHLHSKAHSAFYDLFLDQSILSLPHYPPHYPHIVALRQELERWLFFYFEPRERMRAKNPVKEVHHIGLMGEELASFLNTLHHLDERQFKGIEKSLHLLIPSITGIDVAPNDLGEVELKLREGKIAMPAGVLSEGTLRILGLLALGGVKDRATLIGFEEPENGIHPRRIRLIAEWLKSRATLADNQLIVTTHSPLLVDEIPTEFLYACHSKEGQTIINSFADSQQERQKSLSISERILRGDFDA